MFIVGDSTANAGENSDASSTPRVGWGSAFAAYFDLNRIEVVNAAKAGRSSRTYITEGRWDALLEQFKPGDFVLLQFGHNDPANLDDPKARGSLPGLGEESQQITKPDGSEETVHTFGWYLRKYVAETRAKGALPILLSVTPRNIWNGAKVEPGLGHFRAWAAELAGQEEVDYVDLTGIVVREYEKLGEAKVKTFFPLDHTHTDREGADLNSRCVVAGLKALPDAPLTPFFSVQGRAVPSAAESGLPLPANRILPTLWMIGDSTVKNGQGDDANAPHGPNSPNGHDGHSDQWGWGDEIAPYFDQSRINVVNRAVGGRSSRTYYNFNWPTVLSMMKPGDVVVMQFGHNDAGPLDDKARARGTLPGEGEETRDIENPITRKHEVVHTYGWYLRQMIEQARERRATAVVCSLVPRKVWDGASIHREEYVRWAEAAAHDEHVPFVNLNEIVAEHYERLGPGKVEGLFGDPHTHTNLEGAKLNAQSVIEGLKGLKRDPWKKYFSSQSRRLRPFRDRPPARKATAMYLR